MTKTNLFNNDINDIFSPNQIHEIILFAHYHYNNNYIINVYVVTEEIIAILKLFKCMRVRSSRLCISVH